MTDPELARALAPFTPAALSSAHPEVRVMHPSMTPLFEGAALCGPARTAAIRPGQNAAIHRAVHAARAGEVLVVAGGDLSFGSFGDLLALACRQRHRTVRRMMQCRNERSSSISTTRRGWASGASSLRG